LILNNLQSSAVKVQSNEAILAGVLNFYLPADSNFRL